MTTAEAIRASEDKAIGHSRQNVGTAERLASQVGGGILVATGLLKGGPRGLLLAGLGAGLLYRGVSGHCELYHALNVSTADDENWDGRGVQARRGTRVEEAVTIERSPQDLYEFWRDYANMPRFMVDIASVTGSGKQSHWVLKGPMGATLEWDSELIEDEPGRLIVWESLEGSRVASAGSVRFEPAPDGRGTIVRLNQKIDPPGGSIGILASKVLGHSPESTARETLRRFKQVMEAGEIATTEGQSSGRAS